jgi:hypothetical protein
MSTMEKETCTTTIGWYSKKGSSKQDGMTLVTTLLHFLHNVLCGCAVSQLWLAFDFPTR